MWEDRFGNEVKNPSQVDIVRGYVKQRVIEPITSGPVLSQEERQRRLDAIAARNRSTEYADVSDADLTEEFRDIQREYLTVAGMPNEDLTARQKLLTARYDKIKAEMQARGLDTAPVPARRFGRKPGASGKA